MNVPLYYAKFLRVYDKNCGKKMFSKKIYLALRENLADQVAFKNMGGKMTEVMLKVKMQGML